MNRTQKFVNWLWSFATASDLVSEIRNQGIRGNVGRPCSCIIARFIMARWGVPCAPAVEEGRILFQGWHCAVRLPPHWWEVVTGFDAGGLPDLEEVEEVRAMPIRKRDRTREYEQRLKERERQRYLGTYVPRKRRAEDA